MFTIDLTVEHSNFHFKHLKSALILNGKYTLLDIPHIIRISTQKNNLDFS